MFTENNKFQYAYIKRQALLGMAPTTRLVFWWMGLEANLTSQRWNATGINVMMHTENICLYKKCLHNAIPSTSWKAAGQEPISGTKPTWIHSANTEWLTWWAKIDCWGMQNESSVTGSSLKAFWLLILDFKVTVMSLKAWHTATEVHHRGYMSRAVWMTAERTIVRGAKLK